MKKRRYSKEDLLKIKNDAVLQDLKIIKTQKYNPAYQKEMEYILIEKRVYKNDNGVFNNSEIFVRCVFELHTSKTSSFVLVFDRNDKLIFNGNYLWANPSAKSYNDFKEVLKMLHDFKSIKEAFDA